MLTIQRRQATVELLIRERAATVEDLATYLKVSDSTIRRDLQELERDGVIHRVHGGAVLMRYLDSEDVPEPAPVDREIEHSVEKQAIAAAALTLIAPGSSVLLTGGTTTAALVPLLASVAEITVVTNSLDVAARLTGVDVDLVVLGGAIRRPENSLSGNLIRASVGEVHVDQAVMGAFGLDARSGALGASASECETDRVLARAAPRLTILADASKFLRRSPHRIVDVADITDVVTSNGAPVADVAALRGAGVHVRVVQLPAGALHTDRTEAVPRPEGTR